MTRLLLWRHGLTEWNAVGRFQGQEDVPLSDTGRAEAAAAAGKLAALRPDLIVASDLQRATATAAALSAITGLHVDLDARLRERYFGEWQGLEAGEIEANWPAELARWRAGQPVAGAGVEEIEAMVERVGAALNEILERAAGRTVVVATHGGTARHGAALLLGWPPRLASTLGGLGNCHWTELRFTAARGWQLWAHNVG
jgi:probable phosphoglycerate mutase